MRMTFGRKKTAPVNAQVDASFDGAACKGVVPEVHTEMMGERANNAGVWLFSAVVFALCFAVVAGVWLALCGRIGAVGIAVALIAALMGIMATHIAQQWEKSWFCAWASSIASAARGFSGPFPSSNRT